MLHVCVIGAKNVMMQVVHMRLYIVGDKMCNSTVKAWSSQCSYQNGVENDTF